MAASACVLEFDSKVYSAEAVQKAAYRFINRMAAAVSLDGEKIRCELKPDAGTPSEGIEALIADFSKEVLDQNLRERIKAETAQARNLILSYAFSKSGLQS
jgi:His-Xaa-Ser system protein HxsD